MGNRIIIIGNGIAGISAIKAIREIDKNSEILLFGEEKFYPYYRIKLSKYLFSELSEDSMLIQKKDWYKENRIELAIGKKVVGIGSNAKELFFSDKSMLKYDKLLLSNGASNFKPPIEGIEKAGVFSLRTLQDAFNIREQIKANEHVVIIGGGIQGLETAYSLHQYGAGVTIVELLTRLMPNQLDLRTSEMLKQSIEAFGIKTYLNTKVAKIVGRTAVEGVETDKGELLKCDKVIYSVGIIPNISIANDTQLICKKGIIVNDRMETNIAGVYAAGDAAEFNNRIAGSWNISMAQGRVAGFNIAGKDAVYEPVIPITTLNAFKLTLFSMGCIEESMATEILTEENKEGQYIKVFIDNDRIIGAIVMGDIRRSPVLKASIEKGTSLRNFNLTDISAGELIDKLQNIERKGDASSQ